MPQITEAKLEIVKVERQEDFFALEKDWNRLLKESESDNIFLTFEWLSCWWRAFGKGKKLFILLAKEADEIIGIAPLMVSKLGKFFPGFNLLSFMGIGSSAYSDFIIKKDKKEALRGILKFLTDKISFWDIIKLKQIPQDSPNLSFLKDLEGNLKFICKIIEALPCFYIPLTNGWENYFKTNFSYKTRKGFRRQARKLSEAGSVCFVRCANNDFDNVSKIMPNIFEILNKRWEAKKRINPFLVSEKKEFMEEVAKCFQKKNWLELTVLKCNGKIIAYDFGFCYKQKFWDWNIAFDPAFYKYSPGNMISNNVTEYCFKKELLECDLLQGETWDKSRWARGERKTFEVIIFKKSFLTSFFHLWTVKLKPYLKKWEPFRKTKVGIEYLKYSLHSTTRKIKTTFDRVLFQFKTKGVRNFLNKLIRKGLLSIYERKIIILVKALPNASVVNNLPKIKCICRLGDINDIEILANTRGQNDGQEERWNYEFKERFKQGKLCFMALQDEEVAFNIWASLEDAFDPDIKKKVKVGKDEVFVFDAWWAYRYRGKRVAYSLFEFLFSYFREKKVKNIIGCVDKDNVAPLRVWRNLGFKDVGILEFSRFLVFRRYFFDEHTKGRFI